MSNYNYVTTLKCPYCNKSETKPDDCFTEFKNDSSVIQCSFCRKFYDAEQWISIDKHYSSSQNCELNDGKHDFNEQGYCNFCDYYDGDFDLID